MPRHEHGLSKQGSVIGVGSAYTRSSAKRRSLRNGKNEGRDVLPTVADPSAANTETRESRIAADASHVRDTLSDRVPPRTETLYYLYRDIPRRCSSVLLQRYRYLPALEHKL